MKFIELSSVFEKHGIGYVLEGGSALGAERHGGMIPWDDDFDVAVHEDYEEVLLHAAANDLRKTLIFVLQNSFSSNDSHVK